MRCMAGNRDEFGRKTVMMSTFAWDAGRGDGGCLTETITIVSRPVEHDLEKRILSENL